MEQVFDMSSTVFLVLLRNIYVRIRCRSNNFGSFFTFTIYMSLSNFSWANKGLLDNFEEFWRLATRCRDSCVELQ